MAYTNNLNEVTLQGRIVFPLELKETPNGVKFVKFRIASNRTKDVADYIDCIAWRNNAEFIKDHFSKGDQLIVSGSLKSGSYEKDGKKINTLSVEVDNTHFCGGKEEPRTKSDDVEVNEMDEDDLPF